jgi:hypothetical protein
VVATVSEQGNDRVSQRGLLVSAERDAHVCNLGPRAP